MFVHFHTLYRFRHQKYVVRKFLNEYLMAGLYSPTVLQQARVYWNDLMDVARSEVPDKIRDLIFRTDSLSTSEIRDRLNPILMEQGIRVLRGYQHCPVPLSDNHAARGECKNLLSKKGEQVLKLLDNAYSNWGCYNDHLAELAMQASNKCILNPEFYLRWNFHPKFAQALLKKTYTPKQLPPSAEKLRQQYPDIQTVREAEPGVAYVFPAIQLSQGCTNGCSHCMCRAKGPVSHMPYPMFMGLHSSLFKYYRKVPHDDRELFFRFFYDSDILDYYDPIIGADSGDVAMKLWDAGAVFCMFTKGVKNPQQAHALAKGAILHHTKLSFVDTPHENMDQNLKMFRDTLRVLDATPLPIEPEILHWHLKNGPTVDLSNLTQYPIHKNTIYAVGRAKNFDSKLTRQLPDQVFIDPTLIKPNGDIMETNITNGEHTETKLINLFQGKKVPQTFLQKMKKMLWR